MSPNLPGLATLLGRNPSGAEHPILSKTGRYGKDEFQDCLSSRTAPYRPVQLRFGADRGRHWQLYQRFGARRMLLDIVPFAANPVKVGALAGDGADRANYRACGRA